MPTGHVEENQLNPDSVTAAVAIAHRGIPVCIRGVERLNRLEDGR